MVKYNVEFEYQMPGMDEFGTTAYSEKIIEADSVTEAKEKFREYTKTCPRVAARFYLDIVDVRECKDELEDW